MSKEPNGTIPSTAEFVFLVGLLMSLIALSVDAMLPALPDIGDDLGLERRNDVQFVITTVFVGLGIGQVFFGPLSDSIGRKPAVCVGLFLFMAGCLMSILAHTFWMMIAGRLLQGIGASGPRIVIVALVRDQYEGRQMARLMSYAMAVFILVPTVAPALGQGILLFGDWRAIFATFLGLALIGLVWFSLRQPETLHASRRLPFSLRAVGGTTLEVLRIRSALGYTIASGFVLAPFVAYLTSAQQIFQDAYGTGSLFPLYFGMLALASGGASLANGRLVLKHGMRKLARSALLCVTAVSIIAWALALVFDGLPPFWLFMAYMSAVFLCIGMLFGNLNALAMEPLGHIAGVGAAVVATLSTFISVPFGAIVALSFDGTIVSQTLAFAVFGAGALVAVNWAGRPNCLDS